MEFDRYRDDVVVYDCGSKDFENVLSEYWRIGFGSFSDICLMDVTCCCMNLGIGYYNAHDKNSYVTKKTFNKQIEKFKLFYAKYRDVAFIRDTPFYRFIDNDDDICEMCGWSIGKKVYDLYICEDCFNAMVTQYLYQSEEKSCY